MIQKNKEKQKMKKIIIKNAKTVGAVHTHTHTPVIIIDKKKRKYFAFINVK